MFIKELIDLADKEKRKRERAKTAKYTAGYTFGMIVAVAAGVAIGMLLSPKSGKEIREEIIERTVETVETIKGKAKKMDESVQDSGVHAVKDARNGSKETKAKMKDAESAAS